MPLANPDGLDALKKLLLPGGDYASAGVLENDPELALPQARTNAEFAGNDKLKQVLGLGPSPAMLDQRKELTARDEAVNSARISADPEVTAQNDKAYQQKLGLAGEPNRVKGQSDLDLQRNQQEATQKLIDSNQSAGMRMSINAHGEPSFAPAPADKGLNQQEQALVDSAHQISSLGVPLLSKYAAKYPGIDTDPKKYGSPVSDTLTEKLGKGIYSFGGMTDNDALLQDSAAIQAWGVRALAGGRITKPLMEMISAHLPQPGFSPGANYDRLRRLLTEVLPAQLQGISEGRSANAMSLPDVPSGGDPYSDPNYRPK